MINKGLVVNLMSDKDSFRNVFLRQADRGGERNGLMDIGVGTVRHDGATTAIPFEVMSDEKFGPIFHGGIWIGNGFTGGFPFA